MNLTKILIKTKKKISNLNKKLFPYISFIDLLERQKILVSTIQTKVFNFHFKLG